MRAFYLEGSNITWLNGLCILLFVIGVVGALAMFVIPDKFNLRVCRANLFFFSALMAVVSLAMLIVFTSESFSMDELESGRHWENDCQLLEVNIQTGSFTSPVNKLDCAGIIINVPRLQYDEYIHQWELYKDKNK
ncbi:MULTISPECIES: hypothetical protein [Raoultella]|jgi:hypothetical protein|uniref:hypothetical protein n=1 Tax=Raoultella TaxID=160674 RepID=UPI0004D77D0B|nr:MULTISPECIES: hypothetical protein [Raoultella]HBV7893532.1 hypothetical protein [Klebsiella pneumoniae]EKW7683858.1 hypothetical protein [Raoultella ornithinolytica]KDV96288.1 hypothetical protein AB00_0467 [Raoultella ornithinolytica 2-156-04_S1_C1]KDX16323.1 hypothetical protein AB28_0413 [Raoultella ornithinolytica 2-156-04_S1_C2]MCE9859416.1 hypothetical protein [Raoultella planticola]